MVYRDTNGGCTMDGPRDCLVCGQPYTPHQGRVTQRFCSIQCAGKWKIVDPPTFICETCGKVSVRPQFRLKSGRATGYNYTTKFCSRECGYKGRKWRPINPNGHINKGTGYIRVNLRGGGHAYKHRQVMEETLGRPLQSGENVHHKDGDRANWAPGNLELWTTKQPPGQRVTDKIDFAIEMLLLYPEYAAAKGFGLIHLNTSIEPQPASP